MNLQCIYCLNVKEGTEFNHEHVIHKSMTKAIEPHNLTLTNRVCQKCNQDFGDSIDLKLSRGYWEGMDRFRYDQKRMDKIGQLSHKQIQFSVEDSESFKSEIGKPQEFVRDHLQLDLFDGSVRRLSLSELKRTPLNMLVDIEQITFFRVVTEIVETAEVINELIEPYLGTTFEFRKGILKHEVTATVIYDDPPLRSIAKIGLNYLARISENLPELVLDSSFDQIRKFVKDGRKPYIQPVQLEEMKGDFVFNGRILQGHKVSVAADEELSTVVARVSLFNRIVWKVILSSNYIGVTAIPSASHIWDLDTKVCQKLE